MLTAPFNPRDEKDALSGAVSRFQQQWENGDQMTAFLDLCDIVERAEEVLSILEETAELDRNTQLQAV